MSPSFGICGVGSHICVSYHDPLCYYHSSQKKDMDTLQWQKQSKAMGTLQWQKSQQMVAKFLRPKHVRRPSIFFFCLLNHSLPPGTLPRHDS